METPIGFGSALSPPARVLRLETPIPSSQSNPPNGPPEEVDAATGMAASIRQVMLEEKGLAALTATAAGEPGA